MIVLQTCSNLLMGLYARNVIGAGSRGQRGSFPPGNILALLGDLRPSPPPPPRELYSELKKRSQKSAKTFFLENTYFWDKNAVQI